MNGRSIPAILLVVAVLAVGLIGISGSVVGERALPRPQTWADGELFGGVVTPATFKPESGNFDELYSCTGPPSGSFKDGVPLISESKPGDADYNGGRWHLNVAKNAADCRSKYSGATSVEDLVLSEFMSTPNYFECPLLPRRGNN